MERLPRDLFFSKSLICLFSMQSSSLYCIDLRRPQDNALVEIENPLRWRMTLLLGSCRGALCIYNEYGGQVAIWNLTTGRCTILPPADAEIAHPPACVYGFGYDDENEEYVLLRLIQNLDHPTVSAVSIYRERANAWRRLEGILPYSLVDPRTMGVFLHGCLYWIMRPHQNSAIMLAVFDIHTERSRTYPFRMHLDLATLEGCLCLANLRGLEPPWEECLCFISSRYAWIISGSGEVLRLLFVRPHRLMDEGLLQLLASSQNGEEVLLLHHGTLYWYDLRTRDVEEFNIDGMPLSFRAATRFFICSHLKTSMILGLFGTNSSALYRFNYPIYGSMEYPWRQIKLLGSCHHFLCISNVENQDVAMWNPFFWNREDFTVLLHADVEIARPSDHAHEFGYGFGYNDWYDEYVLLRLVQTMERPIESVTIYYSSGEWETLQGMPLPYYLCSPPTMGVFVRCRLHWIMRHEWAQDSAKVLVAFHLHNKGFEEVHLPDFINNTLEMGLAILEGCLCLTIYDEQMGVDVWIMRDYRLNNRWDRLFSIPDHPENWRPVRPLAYCWDDYQVLVAVGRETLVWYDLVTKTVERIHVNQPFDEAIVIMDGRASYERDQDCYEMEA